MTNREGGSDDATDLFADGCLGVAEAAEFLGVSRSMVYELMDAGQIDHTSLGTRRLIPRRSLTALLANRAVVARANRRKARLPPASGCVRG